MRRVGVPLSVKARHLGGFTRAMAADRCPSPAMGCVSLDGVELEVEVRARGAGLVDPDRLVAGRVLPLARQPALGITIR